MLSLTLSLSRDFAVVPGGGAEERRRAQIRPPLYGAARIHRGVCARARRLPAHGTRHGGGQEVPVPCEFDFAVLLYSSGRLSADLSAWTSFLASNIHQLIAIHLSISHSTHH